VKLIIGIDFDNTIACYDNVFCSVASTLGLIKNDEVLSKKDVKKSILSQSDGDVIWQKLQGQVYGKYMHCASIFPGFIEFLRLCKVREHRVIIISHKTEYGHFDNEKISLRDVAMKWLQENGLIEKNSLSLNRDEIYFESTRESKIKLIGELGCDYFVDDLAEVLNDFSFPDEVKKILFSPVGGDGDTNNSWRKITKKILGDWSESEIISVTDKAFPKLYMKTAELISGRGNSRIYKLTGTNEDQYALKIYPDRQLDPRRRLETEFFTCQYFESSKLNVAKAKAKDLNLNWAIYSWISGKPIITPDKKFVDDAINFVEVLFRKSREIKDISEFNEASEACLSGDEIIRQIHSRMDFLLMVDSEELTHYLEMEFLPIFKMISEQASKLVSNLFSEKISYDFLILSPSDFGGHNAIRDKSNQTTFIDFEYFGWDDPVKLVSDFYWHPGMNLSSELQEYWINSTKNIFKNDVAFEPRLIAYLPLFALRWCLILLNEYLPDRPDKRMHTKNQCEEDVKSILSNQLKKSKTILNQVTKDIPNYGSAL